VPKPNKGAENLLHRNSLTDGNDKAVEQGSTASIEKLILSKMPEKPKSTICKSGNLFLYGTNVNIFGEDLH
jgi:hypothetical protein